MASSTFSSSSSSSSNTSPWQYDVFLSFRGEDTRDTFTAHLYRALTQKGISTYLDEDELRRGDEISPALFQAIKGSRIFIIVLSKNYASSTWCLEELLKILDQCKKSMQQRALPVFYHVDPSNVRHQRKSFEKALAKHAEKLNVDMKKLQLWKAALREVANLSGYHLIRNGNESKFIEKMVQDVSRMANDHLYLHVAEHPVGLNPRVEYVKLRLSVGTEDTRLMGIFGAGGIGKTTLAKEIYNSIAFEFEASCFLPIDSDTSNQVNRLVQLQEKLLSQILGDCRNLKVDNIDKGKYMIKRRLSSKRVLLILDGVDHLDQLKTLVGACDWFGEGSRIIITTRDQHLLTAHGVDSTYEMTGLNQEDAFQLFCWHAFRSEKPVDGYGEFVEQIINYAGSLPLVLTVLGSDLYGRTKKEWVSALDQYRKIPHQDIQKILQTSYERLSDNEKNIFLDIACFFIGDLFDDVVEILDIFDFCPNVWIPRLMEKCLISIFDGRLQMHHMLRDMGREVVRQESPKIPEARSRLFIPAEVRDVLEDDTGTDNLVEGIVIDFPEGDDIIRLSPNAFEKMKRLRFFRCRNAHFSEELNCLPNSIRVLDWPDCPLEFMPSKFRGDKLKILHMPGSCIQEIQLEFKNLTVMNFRGCNFLTKFLDISRCPNLKKIDLDYCKNLVQVHDSVGFLDKLKILSLDGCNNLKSFPRALQLRNLETLVLNDCSSLKNFSEIECEMKHLYKVNLSGTAIEELPSSIGCLTGLKALWLNDCVNFKCLPSSIHQLRSLGFLTLNNCPKIINFGMEEEEVLNGQPTPYVVSTSWENNEASWGAPNGIALRVAHSGQSTSNFFGTFHLFPYLGSLDLSGSDIISIPTSIKTFVRLRYLNLNDCKQLQEIKEFPPNLGIVRAEGCISLESLPEISKEFNFPELRRIDLAKCYKVNMGNWISNPACIGVEKIFPGNKIPDWFSHCKEFTSNSYRYEFDIKVAPLYNLDDIIGIAVCAIIQPNATFEYKVNIVSPNDYVCGFDRSVDFNRASFDEIDSDHVCLKYITTEDITLLRDVSVDQADDHLRIIFENWIPDNSLIFKRCGVHLLYKQHDKQNGKDHENVDVHLDAPIEDIGNLANPMDHGSQLCKRRPVDLGDDEDDHNIEPNLYTQQRKPTSTFGIKLVFQLKSLPRRRKKFVGDRLESLPDEIRVIDWPKCPLQYLPPKFRGNKLVILRMPDSLIRPIRFEFKNLTIMDFSDCQLLTEWPDISSCPNLKEMHLNHCINLVEVHDSVGFCAKLSELSLDECSNLKSFTRRLQLRSLHFLSLRGCSSLQNFPEIGCQMQYLRVIDLKGTAIEELPSSIEHVTGLVHLILEDCVNLKHLPSCLLQWKSLRWLVLDDCPNIVNFGMEAVHNGQSSPYIVSARENEASSSTELFPIPPPTNSAISLPQDSSSLRFPSLYQLDLANSGLTKSNFFGPFHCFPNVEHLDLSHSDIISIPASIKSTFVRLRNLILNDCKKLQEIIEFPTNLEVVDVGGCISLESLPEISEVFPFPRLYSIDLSGCYEVNMGNCMPNPSWNRASMIFPGNNIPDWFSYCKESTSKSHCCELEIKGPPLCLDDIIGIAFCAVIETVSTTLIWVEMPGEEDVSQEVHLGKMDSDHVCLWYLPTEYLTRRASEEADHLRIIFESTPNSVNFKRCGVHLLYKQHDEQNAKDHENVDVHLDAPIKDIGNFANPIDGSPLSKRRHIDHDYDDDDHDIESNLYSQVLFSRHKLVETESVEKKITFYDNRKFMRTSHILRRLRVAANKSASFVLFSR